MVNKILIAYKTGMIAAFLLLVFIFLVFCLALYDSTVLLIKAIRFLSGRFR